jgi:hypothetical protein
LDIGYRLPVGNPYAQLQPTRRARTRQISTIARRVLLKGVGLEVLYPNLLALTAFTLVIVGASVWRYRKQLS